MSKMFHKTSSIILMLLGLAFYGIAQNPATTSNQNKASALNSTPTPTSTSTPTPNSTPTPTSTSTSNSTQTALAQPSSKADTLLLDLKKAEKMFLDSNYLVLAQKYNIDAQKALILQARLFPNPNISLNRGPISSLPDPVTGTPTSFLHNGETQVQLSQLVLLAGKRNKQIKLAEANEKLAEYQFFDLIRTLKYTIRSDFYNIYYLQKSLSVYEKEIKALEQIVSGFNSQQAKGYIAEKEVVRIKAQLYSFKSEYASLQGQIKDIQGELQLLIQVKPIVYLIPQVDTAHIAKFNPTSFPINVILDSANKNRTDLLIAQENTQINKLNYNYQKALAVPDLTLSVAYDHQGSYVLDYTSLGLAIDLPFFNRNQGNIKSAKAMTDNTIALQKSTERTVVENITRSLEKLLIQEGLVKQIDTKFSSDFERLMNEMVVNYQRRNISILDFLDFYDAYKQNALQVNQILYNRIQAYEDLNFYSATNFFN